MSLEKSLRELRSKVASTLLKLAKQDVLPTSMALDHIEDGTLERYLIVLRTDYQGQEDEHSWELADSLDVVKQHVEAHLFPDERPGLDYVLWADVYDLHKNKKVDYEVVQEIRWKEATDGD